MTVSLIVAASQNGVIGRDGDLPWRLPADLRRFKALTLDHHLVMGRKTYDSIGRPLPRREMVVITRNPRLEAEGVTVVPSYEAALEASMGDDEIFVAGGGEIYRLAWPRADRLYLTLVHATIEGDTFLPTMSFDDWILEHEEEHPADEKHGHAFSFRDYRRK